jgi:dephospho-CoA kinase
MKLIGVTGGIGAGKSVVCRVFRAIGVPVYDADERAKWLTNHDPELRIAIIDLLGSDAYDAAGIYNRPWVAAQVFSNPDLLTRLNALIHPRVFADTLAWASQHRHAPFLVREAALINSRANLDKLIVVTAPVEIRIARVRQRDPHRSEADIHQIMDRQMTDDERIKLADYVLANNDSALLLPQIVALDAEFRR